MSKMVLLVGFARACSTYAYRIGLAPNQFRICRDEDHIKGYRPGQDIRFVGNWYELEKPKHGENRTLPVGLEMREYAKQVGYKVSEVDV